MVITTVAQRDGRAKPLTAPTLPCVVERDVGRGAEAGRSAEAGRTLRFVLREGRNRQIRRMCSALGLTVRRARTLTTTLARTLTLTPTLALTLALTVV